MRQTVFAMLGAVIVVLLIACVNVMNMQFGRAALRAKELAICGTLGATRWRLVRQMMTESLLIALMDAIFGVTLAFWALGLLVRAINALPNPLPYWIFFNVDLPVLAFVVAAVFAATIFSGLVPALLSSRGNTAEMMKEGGRGTRAGSSMS